MDVAISQPSTSPDADAFGQKFYDLDGFVMIQAKPGKRLGFTESRSAAHTLETLNITVLVLEASEFSGFSITASTFHLALPLPQARAKMTVYLRRYARPLAQPRGFALRAVFLALHGAFVLVSVISPTLFLPISA
jgi:hypothetical protein